MPMQVIRRAIEAFPETVGFVNAYGQTETTSSLTVLGPDDHRIDGTPEEWSSSSSASTRSASRCPTSKSTSATTTASSWRTAQVGEIIIRTPRIMKGYAGREDDSASARRMARDRRPRMGRRRRLRVLRRPQGRHDHPRRRKYRARRNRNRADEPSGGSTRRGDRRAVGRMGPDRQGLRGQAAGSRTSPRPTSASSAARAWRASSGPSDRVHRRAAQKSARQNPAQRAARTSWRRLTPTPREETRASRRARRDAGRGRSRSRRRMRHRDAQAAGRAQSAQRRDGAAAGRTCSSRSRTTARR